jgi:Flp pilus assembly pilin Flp
MASNRQDTTRGGIAMLAALQARLRADREDGVTAVEYALMVAIIAVLLVGAYFTLFSAIRDRYTSVADCVQNTPSAPASTACAPNP